MENNGWISADDYDGDIPFLSDEENRMRAVARQAKEKGGSDEELPFGDFKDDEKIEAPARTEIVGKCPFCGGDVVENDRGFFCENYDCKFALWKNNRFFDAITKVMTREVAEKLLKDGYVEMKGCKSVRTGKKFNCVLRVEPDEEQKPHYVMDFPKRKTEDEYYGRTESR